MQAVDIGTTPLSWATLFTSRRINAALRSYISSTKKAKRFVTLLQVAQPRWHAGGKILAESYRPPHHKYRLEKTLSEVVDVGGATPKRSNRDVAGRSSIKCADDLSCCSCLA